MEILNSSLADEYRLRAALAKKKVLVMRHVGVLVEDGTNSFHRYNYTTAASYFYHLQAALCDVGLAVSVSSQHTVYTEGTTQKGKPFTRCVVEIVVTITDTETGYAETIYGNGIGDDEGDKCLYKALTSGLKYLMRNTFLIPTGLDVEDERQEVDRRERQPTPTKQPPQPARGSGDASVSIVKATSGQLGQIRKRYQSGDFSRDLDEWIESRYGVPMAELSTAQARDCIAVIEKTLSGEQDHATAGGGQ